MREAGNWHPLKRATQLMASAHSSDEMKKLPFKLRVQVSEHFQLSAQELVNGHALLRFRLQEQKKTKNRVTACKRESDDGTIYPPKGINCP